MQERKEFKINCFHESRSDSHRRCEFVSSLNPELDYSGSSTLGRREAFICPWTNKYPIECEHSGDKFCCIPYIPLYYEAWMNVPVSKEVDMSFVIVITQWHGHISRVLDPLIHTKQTDASYLLHKNRKNGIVFFFFLALGKRHFKFCSHSSVASGTGICVKTKAASGLPVS